ncbi:MAG: hypothetical protein JNJ78_22665 [Anaerolineae bacterium]|nr:hypothetical protein [Anaerolineae bacterium]
MIACIRIPYFAVTLAQSSEEPQPLILARYNGSRGKVAAACEAAVQAGVQVGMSIGRARALFPEGSIQMVAPSQTRRAVERLLDTLSDYSQWLEAKRPSLQTAVLYADIGKLLPAEGQQIAIQMIERLQEQGFSASVGLASGKFTAHLAAVHTAPGNFTLVRKGDEAAYLAPLPVAYLPLDAETARRLDLLGLRRIGQIVTLPRPALIEQFGKPGGQLHRLASGEDTRRVAKYVPPVTKTASRQFEPPLEDRLMLETVLASMSSSLAQELLADGVACEQVLLTLKFDNHSEQEAERLLREPLSGAGILYRTVQPLIDRLKITTGITEVALKVSKIAPIQPRQLALFGDASTEPLENLLVQLSERYEAVFFRVEASHTAAALPELHYHLEVIEAA